jgi:hypothetical protein
MAFCEVFKISIQAKLSSDLELYITPVFKIVRAEPASLAKPTFTDAETFRYI